MICFGGVGGVALNGFVQPHARATLTATVGLVIVPDLLGISAIAELELLNSSVCSSSSSSSHFTCSVS